MSQLQSDRDDATNRLALLLAENARLKSMPGENQQELLKLRGQVAQLQQSQSTADQDDPFTQSVMALVKRAAQLNQCLQQMPDKKIPELQLLDESDWLTAAKKAKLDTDADIRKSLRDLRDIAKNKVPIGSSLWSYVHANNGQLPTDLTQLKPYFNRSHLGDLGLDDATFNAIVQRYTLLHTGNASDYPANTVFVVETAPVDKDYDSREKFGLGTSTIISTGLGEHGDPDDPNY
jgi:multidrug efflux pump subunit AcrA (membrane-fusion protein)